MEKKNPRTTDQGPDPFPFLSNDQNDFFLKAADQRQRTGSISFHFQSKSLLCLKSSRTKTKDQILFSSFPMNKMTSSKKHQTKDQGPDLIQFLFKEEIDLFSKSADQRPRTRSNSVSFH
jgi:hypothetical protein